MGFNSAFKGLRASNTRFHENTKRQSLVHRDVTEANAMDKGIILKWILEQEGVAVLRGCLWNSSGPGGSP